MSQFNFPRINFHGSVLLHVATANNGRFHPLKVYDQNAALPYIPPRVYLDQNQVAHVQQTMPQYTITVENGESYVAIDTVSSADIYIEWAKNNLGTSTIDSKFKPLYEYAVFPEYGITKDTANWIQPGYWNYFGDMSVFTEDVRITGVQLPNGKDVSTYTPGNTDGCPPILSEMLGTSLSFHQDFFADNPRTTAVFCDVDSEGQTCTQMFYGKAGIYDKSNGLQRSFFEGKPCKSTFNWMTLSKVLNWMDSSLTPMSGATYFYSTIDLNTCDPQLQQLFDQNAGENVTKLSMKISVHEVYEVHNPDYSIMPKEPLGNNQTPIPKNPARVAFTGSICPYVDGDMKTNTIARILKNPQHVNIPINANGMLVPPAKNVKNKLQIPPEIQVPPAFLHHDKTNNLVSIDLINTIPEYGSVLADPNPYDYGGDTSIPPFTAFENYDLGELTLNFIPDGSSVPSSIGTITHKDHYNYLAFNTKGGVFDFSVSSGMDYSSGNFYLSNPDQTIVKEDDYLIISDQQGSYAEQNQSQSEGYMSDGLPKGPVIIRAFKRGVPIQKEANCQGTLQTINLAENIITNEPIQIYDGMPFSYPVDKAGCCMYGFAATPDQEVAVNMSNFLYYLSNGYFITSRVLKYSKKLEGLLAQPTITFDDIYNNVLANYHTVLPIMNAILPFDEKTWSDPYVLNRMVMLTSESSWNGFMYMPVTRELSAQQRELLQKWSNQVLNSNQA